MRTVEEYADLAEMALDAAVKQYAPDRLVAKAQVYATLALAAATARENGIR